MSTVEDGAPATVRVFLLDDHEVVRRGIAAVLGTDPAIEVVGEGSTAHEAMVRIPALRPDVAVLDVRLPDGDGVTVCRDLMSRMPDLRVLMLTSFSDDEALFSAILAGASGYLLKQILGQDLVAVERAAPPADRSGDPDGVGPPALPAAAGRA